jgi:hypothetical protein
MTATRMYLIGSTRSDEIINSDSVKLPSCREVLRTFFNFHRIKKLTVRESASMTIDLVVAIWTKFGIPTKQRYNCISQLEKLFDEWKGLIKSKSKRSLFQIRKEKDFVDMNDKFFDVAHCDALKTITNPKVKDILVSYRAGRPCCIVSSANIEQKEHDQTAQKEKFAQCNFAKNSRKDEPKMHDVLGETGLSIDEVDDEYGDEDADGDDGDGDDDEEYSPNPSTSKKNKKKRVVLTPYLSAILDRYNVSDWQAVPLIVAACAPSMGTDVKNVVVSRSTVKRYREQNRSNFANSKKLQFHLDLDKLNVPLTVHWDGKLLPDLCSKAKVERLPIIVSGRDVDQLLAVPKLANGTGEAMADSLAKALEEWKIEKRVSAMCFDTTRSNTGNNAGACILLENKLNKRLLALACRHHILEIVLEKVFSLSLNIPSSGPDIQIFKRLQAQWDQIDKLKFRTAIGDIKVSAIISQDIRERVLDFALQRFEETQPRADYRELLSLTIIFLGGTPPSGVTFKSPGALHRARWMARLLYAFKLYIFGTTNTVNGLFKLTAHEEAGLRELLCFAIAGGYIEAWFSAPDVISAPRNDIILLQRLSSYSKKRPFVAAGAIKKILGHLWYLSEELIAIAFFDPFVSLDEKRDMIIALNTIHGAKNPPKRITVKDSDLDSTNLKLSKFVTKQTIGFFKILGIRCDFLRTDPAVWCGQNDYKIARSIVENLRVVNDVAERGVALIQKFNESVTKNEEQMQYLLQVVVEHRKQCPNTDKSTVIEASAKF